MNIADIAARASTLWERLAKDVVPEPAASGSGQATSRLEQWRRIAADGDPTAFARRLSWDGLTPEAVYEALGPCRWPADRPLPAWTATLLDMVRATGEIDDPTDPDARERLPFLSAEWSFPFEESVCPFVLAGRQRLSAVTDDGPRRLLPTAQAGLERSLLRALCFTASPTLLAEFSAFRTTKRWTLARRLGMVEDATDRTLYDEFIVFLLREGWPPLFERYAALARRMATTVDLWVEATAEFLDRLERDRPTLQEVFGDEGDIGDVVALRPDLSDAHGDRRSVIAVTFASGLKLIYKPKDLQIEQAFGRLVTWIQAREPTLDLRTFRIVDRSLYGWAEFVEQRPCSDAAASAQFYRRAGMLVCLLYVLEGTDGSEDNLIANGDHPVLIDLETLLHHRVRRPKDAGARATDAAYQQWVHSVLHTAMLPVWELRADRRVALDRTGLGGLGDHGTMPGRKWVRINTDGMALERGPIVMGRKANIPTVDGVPVRAGDHVAEIADGFRHMYRFFVGAKDALLSADSPLHEFARQRVRFIHRPTDIYYVGFDVLHDPRHLRDGLDQSIQLEWLARLFARFPERPQLWPLVEAERRALERGDVPRFTASASADGIDVASGVRIEACFDEPSFALVLKRMTMLGEPDLARQVAFIEGAFFAHRAHEQIPAAPDASTATAQAEPRQTGRQNPPPGSDIEAAHAPLGSEQWVEHAMAIARELRRSSIGADDGSAAWIAPHFDVRSDRFHFSPLEDDLYAGTSGMAVFLAAADLAGGGCRELALGALGSLRRTVRSANGELAARVGLGGAVGLGGLIYGLTTVGGLLGEDALCADAARLAALITPETVSADDRLDVLGGAAGAILGLLALHAATGDAALIERAQLCGHHLVASRSTTTTGLRAWATLGGRHLTGISHGAAGIALALLRLHAQTHDQTLHDAAAEAVLYEQQVFSSKAGNWPDYRMGDSPDFPVRWCHGAAGIGLARVDGLPSLDTEAVRSDIDIALAKTSGVVDAGTDHVCCGNMGLAEILLVAGERLGRPTLIDAALTRAAQVVGRAGQRGSYVLHPQLPATLVNPAFFQGIAGIGYTLLRLADPDWLPSVLLWEPYRLFVATKNPEMVQRT